MTSDTSLVWNEDGMDIAADIVSVTTAELVLNLNLVGGASRSATGGRRPLRLPRHPSNT